jgi:hypothetical protein
MMETAKTRTRSHRRLGQRLPLNRLPIRRVLFERIVDAVLGVIVDEITH